MKEIKVCKNPECNNEFVQKHKRHYYCCDMCKYTHCNKTEKHRKSMNKFNVSDKGKARTKRYLDSEKGKIYNRNKAKRQREKYPERYKARIEASKYLPKGLTCSINGCELSGERHHFDYSKPLEVIYLCKSHHSQLHQRQGHLYVESTGAVPEYEDVLGLN